MCDIISSAVAKLQTQQPSSFLAITGDFNYVSLSLPHFQSFNSLSAAPTESKTLDLFYANVRDAFSSSVLPDLCKADHNLVHLSSTYKPKRTKRTARRWSQEDEETLWDCFEATDWMALCEPHGDNISVMTGTDYIDFSVDNTIPTRAVRCG